MELRPGPYFWKISQGKSPLTIPLGRTLVIIHGCQPPRLAYRKCVSRSHPSTALRTGSGCDTICDDACAAQIVGRRRLRIVLAMGEIIRLAREWPPKMGRISNSSSK